MDEPQCASAVPASPVETIPDNPTTTPPSSAVSLALEDGRQGANERIRVFVRVRPLSACEATLSTTDLVSTTATSLCLPSSSQSRVECAFDRIFAADATQADVYTSVQPLVSDVLEGFNATIFAYGQTGTGKTHTILGMDDNTELSAPHARSTTPDLSLSAPSWGIIPRALIQLVDATASNQDCSISCAYLQIYNEKIYDLLTDKRRQKPLMLREALDGTTEMVVQGLSTYPITSLSDVMTFLKRGRLHRVVRETDMNAHSSRSHAILQVTLKCHSKDGVRRAKLNLVDLAGSEKWNKQAVKPGVEIEEMKNINTSLSALGNCIAALTESGRKHIPYRDSSLTRLLQDSLGGNTRTVLIATINPRASDETLRTIQFADRTRAVMQCVVQSQNTPLSPRQMHLGLAAARMHIAKLKQKVHELTEQKDKQADIVAQKFEAQVREKERAIERLHTQNELYQQQLLDGERQIQLLKGQVQALSTPPKTTWAVPSQQPTSNQISHLDEPSAGYRPVGQPILKSLPHLEDKIKSSELYRTKYGIKQPFQSQSFQLVESVHPTPGYAAPSFSKSTPTFTRSQPVTSIPVNDDTSSQDSICSQHQLKNCVLCALRQKMNSLAPAANSHVKPRPSPRLAMPALVNAPSYRSAPPPLNDAGFCSIHHLSRCVLCNRMPAKQQTTTPVLSTAHPSAEDRTLCAPHGLSNCVLCVRLQPQRSVSFLAAVATSGAQPPQR